MKYEKQDGEVADVLIIGAGLAGATLASVLGNQGRRVTLVDSSSTYPRSFKAEKIEEDQADLFRKFNLLDALLPKTGKIHEVVSARKGKILYARKLEQYGILYDDMVNLVRERLPKTVEFRIARVESLETGPELQQAKLSDGETLRARLAIVATGTAAKFCERLGVRRETIRAQHSFSFGFDIERAGGEPFPFDSLTYYPSGTSGRVAYATLFRIGAHMRANFFTYWESGEDRVRQFMRTPAELLLASLPGLGQVLGPIKVPGKVEAASVFLYKSANYLHPGLILLADAFQSVCPTTGSGLTRVLTDVDALSELVPGWLATPGMGVEKLQQYYAHPRKVFEDTKSMNSAEYIRNVSITTSRRWIIHRSRLRLLELFRKPEASHRK